jgi:hypothetical protein
LNDIAYQSWLRRFYTGINTVLGTENKNLFDLTTLKEVGRNVFMAKRCREHPEEDFKSGALGPLGLFFGRDIGYRGSQGSRHGRAQAAKKHLRP